MKIVFFGTPKYVIPVLEKLVKTFGKGTQGVVAVATQPPKPAGRSGRLERSEVDHWAFKKKIPLVFDLDDVPQATLGVVASYGRIIPQEVINKFDKGILNIHPSALPKYRGASPVQSALRDGEEEIGVSVIKMDAQMDHGPIISSFKETVEIDDTAESLIEKSFLRSADFLTRLIPAYLEGKINLEEQDHKKATFTKMFSKEDGYIDFEKIEKAFNGEGALEAHNFIRAMYSWPIAWTTIKTPKGEKRVKLISSKLEDEKLVLSYVQMEGKNIVTWKQFKEAYLN